MTAAPDFWSTLLAVVTILLVSVIEPFKFEDGASHWPWEAGGTTVVTAAEKKKQQKWFFLSDQLIKEEMNRVPLETATASKRLDNNRLNI